MLCLEETSQVLPAGFVPPCLPTFARVAPDGPRWAYEIKHDGFRFIARRAVDNGPMIIDLDRKRMQAMAAKDFATLHTVLSDDLIYTHSSVRLDTKQSLIGNMQSGATVYTSVEPSDVMAQNWVTPSR
jgi:hypothetical protein